jgi:hypothetical protein
MVLGQLSTETTLPFTFTGRLKSDGMKHYQYTATTKVLAGLIYSVGRNGLGGYAVIFMT